MTPRKTEKEEEEKLPVHEEVCPCYLHDNERKNKELVVGKKDYCCRS